VAVVGLMHAPGERRQLDWLELSETSSGEKAHVGVGARHAPGQIL
jgi:hypothetical protein